MMHILSTLGEAKRMYERARHVRKTGFTKYDGTPEQVCTKILDACYHPVEHFFQVSTGHFRQFYVRDFALCCEALVQLGYREKVRNTIRYALGKFTKHGRIATMLTPKGVPYDFPGYGPDTLALFLYTLTHTGSEAIAKKYRKFLQRQVDMFVKYVIDPKTRLPKNKAFTSIRDHTKRKVSCYDATMVVVVARECATLGLSFPYTEKELKELLIETYWNGTYFFNDLQKQPLVIGDANVFPFWTGIVTGKQMHKQAFQSIQAACLDRDMPLRYVSSLDKRHEKTRFNIGNVFAKDYETDSIWMHLGLAYVRELAKLDKKRAREHLAVYEKNIKRWRTFLEIYDNDGDPYRTAFYSTDEGMLWCANWLFLTSALASSARS